MKIEKGTGEVSVIGLGHALTVRGPRPAGFTAAFGGWHKGWWVRVDFCRLGGRWSRSIEL